MWLIVCVISFMTFSSLFGYTIEDEGILLTDQSSFSAVLGDGGIYTNLEDLFKWDQALYTEKLISKNYLDMAFTNQKNN